MDIERVFRQIGYFGTYQKFIWIFVMFYSAMPGVSSQLFLMFSNILPEWSCAGHDGGKYGRDCSVFSNCSTNLSVITDFESTVYEWKLSCQRTTYVLFETIELSGRLIGAILGGVVIDFVGRKWSTFGTYLMLVITGYGSGFSPNPTTFAVFRFISGVFQPMASCAVNTYIFELIDAKHRPLVRTFGGWSMCSMVYCLIAYICGTWRNLAYVMMSLSVPHLIITAVCAVESPRWLVMKKKIPQARKALMFMAKYNKKPLTEADMPDTHEVVEEVPVKNYRFWHLVTDKRMMVYTFVMSAAMFCLGLNKTGVLLTLKLLFGNKYINFFVQALVTQIVMAILMVMELYIPGVGRKAIAMGATAVYVFLLIIIVIITALEPYIGHATVVTVTQYCALLSISGMHSLNGFLFIVVSEIFPTPLRATAFSLCNSFFYVGGTLSTYIANFLNDFWPALSFVVFASLGVFSMILMMFSIPETKHAHLDVKLEQVGMKDIISKPRLAEDDNAPTQRYPK